MQFQFQIVAIFLLTRKMLLVRVNLWFEFLVGQSKPRTAPGMDGTLTLIFTVSEAIRVIKKFI